MTGREEWETALTESAEQPARDLAIAISVWMHTARLSPTDRNTLNDILIDATASH